MYFTPKGWTMRVLRGFLKISNEMEVGRIKAEELVSKGVIPVIKEGGRSTPCFLHYRWNS